MILSREFARERAKEARYHLQFGMSVCRCLLREWFYQISFYLFRTEFIAKKNLAISRTEKYFAKKVLFFKNPSDQQKLQFFESIRQTLISKFEKAILVVSGWSFHNRSKPIFVGLVTRGLILGRCLCDVERVDVPKEIKGKPPKDTGFELYYSLEDIDSLENISVCSFFDDGTFSPLNLTEKVAEAGFSSNLPEVVVDEKSKRSFKLKVASVGFFDKAKILGGSFFKIPSKHELEILPESKFKYYAFAFENLLDDLLKKGRIADAISTAELYGTLRWRSIKCPFMEVTAIADPSKKTRIEGVETLEINPSYDYSFSLPNTYPQRNKPEEKTVKVPAEELHCLRDATVIFGNIVLTTDRKYFLHDPSANPNFDFVSGSWRFVQKAPLNPDYCLVKGTSNAVQTLETAILLDGRCSFNYFHWLVEYLPRIKTIRLFPNLKVVPIIVNANMPQSMKDSLHLIAPEHPIVWNSENNLLKVGTLYIPSLLTYIPDDPNPKLLHQGSAISRSHLEFIRESVFEKLGGQPEITKRKLFLSRSPNLGRAIGNIQEIEQIAVHEGFELVDPSKYSFSEQARMFASAAAIVGPGGAAFSNLIFCNEKCQILSFIGRHNSDFSLHPNLANFAGAKYTYILGEINRDRLDYQNPNESYHAGYIVNPRKFKRALMHFGLGNTVRLKNERKYLDQKSI